MEDDAAYARLLVENLHSQSSIGVTVTVSARAGDAVARLRSGTFDAVVLDLDLPDNQGLDSLGQVTAAAQGTPILILTSTDSETMAVAALRAGAEEYLVKHTVDSEALATTVRHAVARRAYREAVEALEARARHERFRLFADNIREALIVIDMPTGHASYLSRMFEEIWGRRVDEAYAEPQAWFEAIEAEDRPVVASRLALLRQGEPASSTFRIRRPDGTVRCVRGRLFPILDERQRLRRLVGLIEDITQMRHTEEQLRQALKMEAVGRLAGGVAHDFNNLLVVIDGYAQLIAEDLGPSHGLWKDIDEIRAAAKSAASLTNQLLAFSRRQILQPQILDLNRVLRRVELLLRRVIGEDITLVMKLSEPLGRVSADSGQIEQVMMNLAVNARDAMPRGGQLTIESADVELDQTYVSQHPGAAPGRHVMIAVSDTGVGMDEATQQRLFEPFFTTKPPDQGTGLGLATVYGIVKQSRGSIWVYSEPGKGTTFKIYLPAVGGLPSAMAPAAREPQATAATETLLIVEDNPEVRRLIENTLARHGYTVLAAGNAPDAIALARGHPHRIDALLTDVVLPGTSGREIAREVLAERPGLRVAYMSGYTDDAIVQHGVLEPGLVFLQKPFTKEALLRKLRDLLTLPEPPPW